MILIRVRRPSPIGGSSAPLRFVAGREYGTYFLGIKSSLNLEGQPFGIRLEADIAQLAERVRLYYHPEFFDSYLTPRHSPCASRHERITSISKESHRSEDLIFGEILQRVAMFGLKFGALNRGGNRSSSAKNPAAAMRCGDQMI